MSHPGFRNYWIGMTVTTTSFWAYRAGLAWLVWEVTKSPAWLGLVAFAEMVPMLLIGPIAGAMTDRIGAMRMARIATAGWAGAVGLLAVVTVADLATREALLILAVLQGVVGATSNPAHLALIAKLVPAEDLSTAIAMQSGTVQTGRFIGPAIAGPLLVLSGAALVFFLVTAGFLFFLLMLFRAHTLVPEVPNPSTKSLFGDLMDGVHYAAGHFAIRTIIVFSVIVSLLLRPVTELLPGFADEIFQRGPTGLAWLLAAVGFGAIFSSVWMAVRGRTTGLTRIFSLNVLIGAIALFAFAWTENFWLGLALIALFGFSSNTAGMCSQTLMQHMVDGQMRARVMSLLGISFRAAPALGALVLGAGQSLLGLGPPIMIGAVLCVFAWISLETFIRRRNLAALSEETSAH